MIESFWVLLLFPLVGAAVNGLLGKRLPERVVGALGSLAVLASFGVAVSAVLELARLPEADRSVQSLLFTWIEAGQFRADVSFLLDPLSAVMILVVTGVGFLIHVYSMGYMHGESGYWRYFAYLNLFIFMMSVLVLADNYLLMFVGWEGVGLCSYLLIGYYFETKEAGDAAKKAFIVNRIGDVGFILGVFVIFSTFDSVNYHEVFSAVASAFPEPEATMGTLGIAGLLLFVGAVGKSAQIPLFVWLPDAMAGPTPVSALIHAATMVTAGVYMIARSAPIYSRSPEAMAVVATVGVLTALLAALVAIGQRDIKKVLAYSTVSQLGYMFLGVGVGAFSAGIFHLFTHAFFKALLFLGSGSVILAMHHEQDMLKMGGLRRHLPLTWATMGIATLAIAGIPPLSGFFSKDEILWQSLSSPNGHLFYYVVGVLVAGLTAFYMFRLMFLTFHGPERFESDSGRDHGEDGAHSHGHEGPPREPSWLVIGPLAVLALLSAGAGLIGPPAWLGTNRFEHFLEPSLELAYRGSPAPHHSVALEVGLAAMVVVLAIAAIWTAYSIFLRNPAAADAAAARFPGTAALIRNKFYVDEIYDALIVHPIRRRSRDLLWKGVDVGVIDGLVNGTAAVMLGLGNRARKLQSGYVRAYAGWILAGAVLLLAFLSVNG